MPTRLKIDLEQGLLEVEGSETFVRAIYNDFKVHFVGVDAEEVEKKTRRRTRRTRKSKTKKKSPSTKSMTQSVDGKAAVKEEEKSKKSDDSSSSPSSPSTSSSEDVTATTVVSRRKATPEKYSLIEGLELGAAPSHPALVEFMDAKFPITNEERNVVFMYYLQYMLKLDSITPNHIYTCYKAANIRVPLNMEKSLEMTADQYDWINITESEQITLTATGRSYVESQLPKKVKN